MFAIYTSAGVLLFQGGQVGQNIKAGAVSIQMKNVFHTKVHFKANIKYVLWAYKGLIKRFVPHKRRFKGNIKYVLWAYKGLIKKIVLHKSKFIGNTDYVLWA